MFTLITLLISTIATVDISELRAVPPLQPLPYTHEFDFVEKFEGLPLPPGPGRWVYDWPSRRGIIYHSIGSIMFCSPNDPMNQGCFMLYQPDALWVLYQNDTCCKLCLPKDGCGLLRPDFLSNNSGTTYQGIRQYEGETCYGYGVPGSVTLVDSWWTREDGVTVCAYHEEFSGQHGNFSHDLVAVNGTFTENVNMKQLMLPPVCTEDCPVMYPFGPSQKTGYFKF